MTPSRRSRAGSLLAGILLLAIAHPASGGSYSRALTIPNPAPSEQALFGNALAVLGNDVLVGVPLDDTMGSNAGAVYRFDGTTGALVKTYFAPNPVPDAYFGESVDVLGGNLLVGASLDDVPGTDDAGAAYLLDADTGAALLTFVSPTPAAFSRFGGPARAIGGNVVVQASFDDPAGPEYASVYLFDGTTGDFLHKFTSSSSGFTGWGLSSIGVFGTNLLVGAFADGTAATGAGAAFVYDADPGSGTFGDVVKTFVSPNPVQGEGFGDGFGTNGSDLLISATGNSDAAEQAGILYVFDGASGDFKFAIPNPNPAENDRFGNVVTGVAGDIVVGVAQYDDPPELASGVLYRFDGTTGMPLQTILNPLPETSDFFGNALAALGDQIVVAAVFDSQAGFYSGTVYVYDPCGNGVVTASEQCDDGNELGGDCCSATCLFETGPCDDGDACTVGEVCTGGACGGGSPLACNPCLTCDSAAGCVLPPPPACQAALAGKASVRLRKGTSAAKDQLTWKWTSSEPVEKPEFGSPHATTDLALCVLDQSGLLLGLRAPAGGTCRGRDCWLEQVAGFRYAAKDLTPDGLAKLSLKAGPAGRAKIALKGKGANLAMPPLGLVPPVTVRLIPDDGPACWEASYGTARRNDSDVFQAKSD